MHPIYRSITFKNTHLKTFFKKVLSFFQKSRGSKHLSFCYMVPSVYGVHKCIVTLSGCKRRHKYIFPQKKKTYWTYVHKYMQAYLFKQPLLVLI